MGLFKSVRQAIERLLSIGAKETEDPETILNEAREAMERESARTKENAVAAIGRRNALRSKLSAREMQFYDPELDWVDTEIAKRLHAREKRPRDPEIDFVDPEIAKLKGALEVDPEIAKLRQALEGAERDAAAVKQSLQALEAQVRLRAAERLAYLGWKQARIQEALNKALSGLSLDGHDQAFERARERVRRAAESQEN